MRTRSCSAQTRKASGSPSSKRWRPVCPWWRRARVRGPRSKHAGADIGWSSPRRQLPMLLAVSSTIRRPPPRWASAAPHSPVSDSSGTASANAWPPPTKTCSYEAVVILSPEPRFLVLTPAVDGADGISELSRQVSRALARDVGPASLSVWALDGNESAGVPAGTAFFTARGSRLRLLMWTLAAALRPADGLTVVVVHVHLAPLGAMLSIGGARLAVLLIGVEAWKKLRRRERYGIERADRVLCISQHTADRFHAVNSNVQLRSTTICRLGVEPEPREVSPYTSRGFALIVARMSSRDRYKGHDRLIDVWPAVRARVPDARLVVVGDGDDRARLEARATAGRLGAAIQFTGRLDDASLAGVYRAAAFFVMPSTNEGFGLAYLEAMRAGKACIALHGAADEFLDDGVAGVLVDGGDTDGLVDAVVRLFSDPDLRARMGAAGALRVAREFTETHFAARLPE